MSEQKRWFAIEVKVKPQAAEAIEFAFNNLNSQGTEIDSLRKSLDEDVCVVGYFDHEIDLELAKKEFVDALRVYGFSENEIVGVVAKEIENQDWLAEWKKHWKPTSTRRFIVAPAWEEIADTTKFIIRIEPNMAFGTGTHETTQLCLQAIENHYQPGMSFFDVGTGTGILSIAVSKTAETTVEILACDVDSDSVKIAKENALLNDADQIKFYEGSISEETEIFDFVCANVTADIIIPMLPVLVEKFRKVLVLSGILVEQEDEVLQELGKLGIEDAKTKIMGEWISIIIER